MISLPADDSLFSSAQITLIFTGYVLILALSFLFAMSLPYIAFHAGRWIYDCHMDVGHAGTLIACGVGFFYYSGLCGFAPDGKGKLWYIIVNVPFGVGFLTALCSVVFAVGVGIGRVTGLIEREGNGRVRTS